jgi:hypothetical protein
VARVTGRRRFVSSATRRILQFSGVGESTAPGPRLRRTDERSAERALVAQRVHDPLSPAAASNLSDADRTPRSYRFPLRRTRLACRIGSHRPSTGTTRTSCRRPLGPLNLASVRPAARCRTPLSAVRAELRPNRRHRRALGAIGRRPARVSLARALTMQSTYGGLCRPVRLTTRICDLYGPLPPCAGDYCAVSVAVGWFCGHMVVKIANAPMLPMHQPPNLGGWSVVAPSGFEPPLPP